ncbi:MAG: hypothetical protein U0Z53_29010 [Blastocatellia bacterium]
MSRTLTIPLTTLIASGRAASYLTLELTLAAGAVLRFATGLVADSGGIYQPLLRQLGALRQSQTRAADRIELGISNIDQAMGLLMADPTDVLRGARAVIRKVFLDDTGALIEHTKPLMKGVVMGAKTDEEFVRLTIWSDLAAARQIAGWKAMQKNCNLRFNVPGTACDYANESALAPEARTHTNCPKTLEACLARGMRKRYGGFVYLEPLPPPVDPDDTPGKGGPPMGGGTPNPIFWKYDTPIWGDTPILDVPTRILNY